MTLPSSRPIKQTIMQGEAKASADDRVIMSTILGSCVATCLYDPVARIGGMNHYLLAKPLDEDAACSDSSYGLFLMELLINEMLKLGAQKKHMKARIYGGANMATGLKGIGTANAAFARQFLRDESIPTVFEDLEGSCARRVDFSCATGRVRARHVTGEAPPPAIPPRPIRDISQGGSQSQVGDVDLF